MIVDFGLSGLSPNPVVRSSSAGFFGDIAPELLIPVIRIGALDSITDIAIAPIRINVRRERIGIAINRGVVGAVLGAVVNAAVGAIHLFRAVVNV